MITILEAKEVIKQMPEKFNSHQFIERYILCYTWPYLQILKRYKDVEIAHRQIGTFLLKKEKEGSLPIKKEGTEQSENIFGNNDTVALWKKDVKN